MGCLGVTLILNKEFQYLGYKWLRIGDQAILHEKNALLRLNFQSFPPLATLTSVNNSLILGGFFGHIFNIFNTDFNISFEIIKCKDSQFGAFINGSWTGMISDLTQGLADISLSALISRQLSGHVHFSPQMFSLQFDVVYRILERHEWDYDFYSQPCQMEIWLCVFAISLTVIIVKGLVDNVLNKKNCASSLRNLINDLLLCWPIYYSHRFSSKSIKFIFGIYIAFSMLLLISYTSMLTSLLAKPDAKVPFSSLTEMLEKTDFTPVIFKGGKFEEMFSKTPYENKRVLRADTGAEAIDLIYSGKMAFLGALKEVQQFIGENCSFDVALEHISREQMAIAYSKHFPYVDYFNFKILLLKQYGILSVEYERATFFNDLQRCSLQTPFNPVSFSKTVGAFVVLMSGVLISLVVGIFELIVHKLLMM
uniref:Ionotropic glutamate receptor C-terminal domain-containing protein n=1 Tax=Strigamia maritima TaxID=126957 RepID=T1INX5_STRMM